MASPTVEQLAVDLAALVARVAAIEQWMAGHEASMAARKQQIDDLRWHLDNLPRGRR